MAQVDKGFIKLIRFSANAEEVIRRRSSAFCLLTLIALRARRKNDTNFDDLELGEALIGDFESYGATEQVYRTDKKFLETFNFITTRTTNRGTIAKLVDTTIFDINIERTNDQPNSQLTTNQRTANDQLTTNKNIKNIRSKEVKREREYEQVLEHFNSLFDRSFKSYVAWQDNYNFWRNIYSLEEIKQAITNWKENGWWVKQGSEELTLLFRTKNKNGKCDYIGELLNSKGRSRAL